MAQGMDVGALPSGRLAGAPLSDGGISPCTGCDTRGPTCVMTSVGKATNDFHSIRSAVLNQKIPQSLLSTPEAQDKFIALLETYFEGYNGYQVNGIFRIGRLLKPLWFTRKITGILSFA